MKINQAFPSKYIKCEDLNGREVPCKIARVLMEDVGAAGSPEEKAVMYFAGKTKGIVLNKTNAMTISLSYGEDTDDWVNKDVILYPATTPFQGQIVPCIRLRIPAMAHVDDSEIPF